jgi:hypothetical protein
MSDEAIEVTALAVNITIPEHLRWTDSRRGEEFSLTTLNVRLLPDGRLARGRFPRGRKVGDTPGPRVIASGWPQPPSRPLVGGRGAPAD